MKISRRNALKLGAGAAAALATGVNPLRAETAQKIPIGLQLYSVRKDCSQDLPGVLQAVAKMGYQGVEFAGYYGRDAKQLRKLLDDNGLKCCGTHTHLNTLADDAFMKTVEFNKTLGNKFLIVPSLPRGNTSSVQALKDTAKLFTKLAAKARPLDMRVGYHAHGGDFRDIEGQTPWDILFGNAGKDVVMQLDTGNCLGGGGDPVAVLKKYPGQTATIHLKEHGGPRNAVLGDGDVKWNEIFELCETIGGTEWYIVEQERYNGSPLDTVKACIDNLRKMGK